MRTSSVNGEIELKVIRFVQPALVLFLLGARTDIAQTQAAAPSPSASTATVVAGPDYDVGGFTRALFGEGWRSVWTAPVRVPVFDIGRFAGGVVPTERGGGNQTVSLRFREANGWREYHFRSVDKDPVSLAMPAAVRGTMLGGIVQDLTSSLFPAAGLMVPPLLDAVGALHVTPSLYVMPNDPRLGEFREAFAGMLGTVELSPDEAPEGRPGFGDSRHIENGEDFLETVRKGRQHRLDEREFFAVRLVDFLINDNDRTPDNIRFARYGDSTAYRWRVIPRDRDRAFTDARGWVIKFLIRPAYPKLIEFSPRYSLSGLTFESSNLDRRLLQRLTLSDALEIGSRVQRTLDDATIDRAIAQLPVEWRQKSGGRLRSVLRARRDGLAAFAREFYGWLATEVDVHGTDDSELVVVDRLEDGGVTVSIMGKNDPPGAQPFSRRTFVPAETNEVRIYLHDGSDSTVVRGASSDAIVVRVIGGDGNDFFADTAGGDATRFYDAKGDNKFVTKSGTRVSLAEWDAPRQGAGVRVDAPWRPDWGSSRGWGPSFDYGQGAGLIIGFGPRYSSQGFRRLPHKTKASADLLLGTGNLRPGFRVDVDHRAENSPLALTLAARATKFEEFRFYGFGNDVPRVDRPLYEVEQDLIAIEPAIVWQIGWRSREDLPSGFSDEQTELPGLRPLVGRLEAGPVVFWNDPKPVPGSPLSDESIPGSDSFGRAGLRLGISLDLTAGGAIPDRGWVAQAELEGYPPIWDLERSFSTATGQLATYVPLPGDGTHLALRVGGALASGAFPVQHAPAVGGRRTLRGYGYQRFRGETSAFGSAELRVPVGVVPFFIKWNTGVFGLADAGRVWFEGRSEGGWHSGFGGGVWVSSLGQTFTVSYAHGEQHRFYFQKGMSF